VRQGVTAAMQFGNDPLLVRSPILPKSSPPAVVVPEEVPSTTKELPAGWLV
jgi:hypothetical protein